MTMPRSKPVWPAYTIASLALFCAVDGPAHAAALITGADIKDGSVTSADVKDNSVKASDVKNGSLGAVDLSEAARDTLATAGACGPGQKLIWLRVDLTADNLGVDNTVRIGRCVGTGDPIMGDGVVQPPEECDGGAGCDNQGQLTGTPGLDFSRILG